MYHTSKDTVKTPAKLIFTYPADTAANIASCLPKVAIRKPRGDNLRLGRNRKADVLLNDEQMSREFAEISQHSENPNVFIIRNLSHCKSIQVGQLLLHQNEAAELTDQTLVTMEKLTLLVNINFGDPHSAHYEAYFCVNNLGGEFPSSHRRQNFLRQNSCPAAGSARLHSRDGFFVAGGGERRHASLHASPHDLLTSGEADVFGNFRLVRKAGSWARKDPVENSDYSDA